MGYSPYDFTPDEEEEILRRVTQLSEKTRQYTAEATQGQSDAVAELVTAVPDADPSYIMAAALAVDSGAWTMDDAAAFVAETYQFELEEQQKRLEAREAEGQPASWYSPLTSGLKTGLRWAGAAFNTVEQLGTSAVTRAAAETIGRRGWQTNPETGELYPTQMFESVGGSRVERERPTASWTDIWKTTDLAHMINGVDAGDGMFVGEDSEVRRKQREQAIAYRGAIRIPTDGGGYNVVGDTPGRTIATNFFEPGTDAYNFWSGAVDATWAISMPSGAELVGPTTRIVSEGAGEVTKGAYRSTAGLTNSWTPWIRSEKVSSWLESNAGQQFIKKIVDVEDIEQARLLAKNGTATSWNRMVNAADEIEARQFLEETLGMQRGFMSSGDIRWSRWSEAKQNVLGGVIPRYLGVERGLSRSPGKTLKVGFASEAEITETVSNAIDWFKLLKVAPEDRKQLLTRFTNALIGDKADVRNILGEMEEVFVEAFQKQGYAPELIRGIFTRHLDDVGQQSRFGAMADVGGGDLYGLGARQMLMRDEATGELYSGRMDKSSGFFDSEHRRWTIDMPDPRRVARITKNINWMWTRKARNKAGELIENPQLPAEFLDAVGKPRVPTQTLDFIHNRIWKRAVLATGGYAFRITMEGTMRQLMAPGIRSGVFHPFEFVSSLLYRGNNRYTRYVNRNAAKYLGSLEGDLWADAFKALSDPKADGLFNEHFNELLTSVVGGMRQELDPGVLQKAGFKLGSWSTATRADPEFPQGMADNIHLLANDRLARLVAQNYSADDIIRMAREGDKTVLEALRDLQTRHASRITEDWSTGQKRRGSLVLFDKDGDVIDFAVRNIIDSYVAPRLSRFTLNDPRLREIVANGERFGMFKLDPDGDDIRAFQKMVDGMFGPEARGEYAKEMFEVIADAMSRANPDDIPQLVKYRVNVAGYRPDQVPQDIRELWNTFDAFTTRIFADLLSRPDQFLNRNPVWRRFYHQGLDLLLPQLDEGEAIKIIENINDAYRRAGGKGLPDAGWASRYVGSKDLWNRIVDLAEGRTAATGTRTLEEVSFLARGFASDETQKLLYDATERSNWAAAGAIVSPFLTAWAEGVKFWPKAMLANPQKSRQMYRSFQGLSDADPDNNGQGIFYKHPTTGEWVFDYPYSGISAPALAALSSFLVTSMFAGPVVGAAAGASAGTYMAGAARRAENAGVEPILVGNVRSANVALNVSPGFGAGLQMPISWVLDKNWIPYSDDIARFLLPFGPPSGGVLGPITPAYISKFTDVFSDDPNQARYYADAKIQAFDALYMTGKYDRNDGQSMADLDADASSMAKYLVLLRSMGQFVGPVRPNVELKIPTRFEGQITIDDVNLLINEGDVRNVVLSRAFRLLQEEDYNTAVPRFLEMFGDESLGFVVGKTYTNTDGLQASREFGDWVIANPDLVNNAPEVYAYFAGDVGSTFDFYTFSKQIRTNDRARWTDPIARLENSEAVAGRALYLEAVRNSGVDDNPFREEFLREYRNFLEQSLPGFLNEPMYTNIQDIQIRRLQDALELDATIGNPAADGMRMYFEYRDDAIRVAQARRTESGRQEVDNEKALSGNSNSDLRSLLRIVGFKISQDNPAFAKVWSEVLFTEVDI